MSPKNGTQPWIERLWRTFRPRSPVVDAGGRFRVSEPFGIHDNKNISSSNPNQWHEEIYGAILEYAGLTGTFSAGGEIRGTIPAGKIPIGTVISDSGTALTIYCSHNNFTVGDTITQTTGAGAGATATLTTTNTGSDIQHDYNNAGTKLRVGTGANDYAIRQSVMPAAYVAGKGQNPDLTFKMPIQKANVVTRAGVFNQYDGLFFEVTEDDITVIVRSSVSGTASDARRYVQSSWNLDKLDGSNDKKTNPSGKTLNPDKVQFLAIPYLWQGVGSVKFGFIIDNELIYFHEVMTANRSDTVYMRNPSLPIRYEIRNAGVTASPTEMLELCSTISSEGGYNLPGLEFVVDDNYVSRAVTTTFQPILAIRLKSEFPTGKHNFRIVRFLSTAVEAATNDAYLRVVHVHDPVDITGTGGAATWQSDSGDSGVEYSLDINGYVGRPSHNILPIYAPTTTANKSASTTADVTFINLHSFIAQNYDSTNSQMFVLEARSKTGTSDIRRSFTFIEFE